MQTRETPRGERVNGIDSTRAAKIDTAENN